MKISISTPENEVLELIRQFTGKQFNSAKYIQKTLSNSYFQGKIWIGSITGYTAAFSGLGLSFEGTNIVNQGAASNDYYFQIDNLIFDDFTAGTAANYTFQGFEIS